jgi:sporulation protein YlmC with PRC-barrel domain
VAEDAEEVPGPGGEDAGRLIAASQLEQTPVFDAQGHHLGRIAALMLDRSSGRVVYVVLLAAVPGGSERLVPLPWSKLTYDATKDRYAADIDERTWKAAPSYGAAETPWTEPRYDREISDYYGAPWYE